MSPMPQPGAMMPSDAAPLAFKYKYVRNGHELGFRSKQGTISPGALQLDAQQVSFDEIADTAYRDNRLMLALDPRSPARQALAKVLTSDGVLALAISGALARDMKRRIDRHNSARSADGHRRQLAAAGRDSLFRAAPCPVCGATIDFSETNPSSYLYCPYCESLLAPGNRVIAHGDQYAVCDECRLFGRIQGYTEFYFYFLLIVYGFSWKRRFVCDSCAQRMFTKTLLVNLIFLLGVPPAIWIKIKSLMGRDPSYGQIAKANTLASKGNFAEADPIYRAISQTYPEHPGLLRNAALAHFNGKDVPGAMDLLNRALRACPNYGPAGESMRRLQTMLAQAAVGR
jgi:hypothetical protein